MFWGTRMITLDTRVRPDDDVVDTELEGGEMVLLHLLTKQYYSLNVTGIRIWQALKGGSSLQPAIASNLSLQSMLKKPAVAS